MVQEMVEKAKPKMEGAYSRFIDELRTVRIGRASANMLDQVVVSYYGNQTPLKALATIMVPDATQIVVQPFDIGAIHEIRTAITDADLGFNPSDDGRTIRISVPPLTAERREDLVKIVGKIAEAARVSVRTIRGDIWEHIQEAEKKGEISEDNRDWGRKEIDQLTAEYNKKIETVVKEKEAEIRTV